MIIKEKWTDSDFDEMGWHDSRLYQLKFPNENCDFILYIDYIFKWVERENKYDFWVSPCELVFENVINLSLNLNFKNSIGIDIDSMERKEYGLTPNKKFKQWKYTILTDKGDIEFISTSYIMNVISQPVLSNSQSLND